MRNARLRWNEHEIGKDKNSECAKHLNENDNHEFKWSILSLAPKVSFKRKILEDYFIKTLNPAVRLFHFCWKKARLHGNPPTIWNLEYF